MNRFSFKDTYGRLYGKTFHKAAEFFPGKIHGFIRITGPLVDAVRKAFNDQAETIPVKTDPLDAVAFVPAEEEECSIFQWIEPILKADNRDQSCYTPPQVSAAAPDYHAPAPGCVSKHS